LPPTQLPFPLSCLAFSYSIRIALTVMLLVKGEEGGRRGGKGVPGKKKGKKEGRGEVLVASLTYLLGAPPPFSLTVKNS